MTQVQKKLLEMLSWFHLFCIENEIRYYMIGGTMLGAARHEGFIPWDDDIDIGVPRKDYEKLTVAMNGLPINSRYKLETPETTAKDYFYPFAKLYDTTTTLIENTKHSIKRGIYLDIFPLDGIGNTKEEAVSNYKRIDRLHNLLVARVTGIRKGRHPLKNLAVLVLRCVPRFVFDEKKQLKKLTHISKRFDYDSCSWCGNLVGAWHFKELIPKEILGEPKLYKFENVEAFGVEDADKYLTYLYGDWRQLPPEEKRKSHHDYVLCDLEKSYLEN